MSDYTPQSGVYIILNTQNTRVYIGKAVDIKGRWRKHKSLLKHNNHTNKHLQNAWNKYGEKAFKFQVLEYCPTEQLNEREMHHIAIYKRRGIAYNFSDGGGASGMTPSEETREKQSKAKLGKKLPPRTPEHCQHISESAKNRWAKHHYKFPQTSGENNKRHKLTQAQAEEIRKIYATGDVSQYALADQFNVSQQTISKVITNKRYVA